MTRHPLIAAALDQLSALSDQLSPYMKAGFDVISMLALLGWFVEALPAFATFLTIVWTIIRIAETETVKRWVQKEKADQEGDNR